MIKEKLHLLDLVAVILTQNEAHNVTACITSLRDWVDAVVVWDGGSTDDTAVRAQQAGALVVQRPFDHFFGIAHTAFFQSTAERRKSSRGARSVIGRAMLTLILRP